ncbi:MAG: RidA family protein [Candidatus Rokubacteria bacterium]|nr:RidA family protein [Candidatus Rokubacteria bacterium]
MLRDHPTGGYRFLPGITAFSSGVVAMPGSEIVHATLGAPVPWREGFARIDRHLREVGRPRTALCGIELRSPAPFTFDGFAAFNEGYRALLAEWGILVGDDNPIPRTNVAPVIAAPAEPSLYAFDYTVPGTTPAPAFVVAGAGEMRDRGQGNDGIVRYGDTSPDAMREKARFVMGIMKDRMQALGAAFARVTVINVYCAEPIHGLMADVLGPAGGAAIHGLRWFPSRPPVKGLEFEVDMRGVARELVLER